MHRCEYLNQARYNLDNVLVGSQCKNDGNVFQTFENVALAPDPANVRIYHFCNVHSYTADRLENVVS